MNLNAASESNPIKLKGETTWVLDGKPKRKGLTTALVRSPNSIVVEAKIDNRTYTSHLSSLDGIKFATDSNRSNWNGVASCIFYSNKTCCLLLGEWIEDGYEYLWLVELK